ncbi:MAG: DMT family transporter [Candidatus Margulisbacteria bacterium]|nr:DMT family transporter [Candidatus Margulisiibacteriota bacterium]
MADQKPLVGIFFIIAAFLAYAIMSGFVKACSLSDLPVQEIIFFQNIFALVILLPWLLKAINGDWLPKNKLLVVSRALLGLLSFYLFFVAVKLVPLVNAVLLQNTTPFFIPLLALIFFRKKITLRVWISVMIGFVGVTLVLNPGRGFLRSGDLIALAAGLMSAITTILVGRLDEKKETIQIILFYLFTITILVTGLWSIPNWQTPLGILWIYLIVSGILYAVFQVFFVMSLKFASATTIAPFIYMVVVFSGIVDWVVWHQTPGLLTVVGAAVVIGSGIFSALPNGKRTSTNSVRGRSA